jgi:DNA helicase II / ATP-dependent DNA helicase PcrA
MLTWKKTAEGYATEGGRFVANRTRSGVFELYDGDKMIREGHGVLLRECKGAAEKVVATETAHRLLGVTPERVRELTEVTKPVEPEQPAILACVADRTLTVTEADPIGPEDDDRPAQTLPADYGRVSTYGNPTANGTLPRNGQHRAPETTEGEADRKGVVVYCTDEEPDCCESAPGDICGACGKMVKESVPTLVVTPKTGIMGRLATQSQNTDDAPHCVVEALAGTGKSTTLLQGLRRLFNDWRCKCGGSKGFGPTGAPLCRVCENGSGVVKQLTPSPQQAAVWDTMCLSAGKARTACFVAFNKAIAEELKEKVPASAEAMTNHGLGFRALNRAFRGLRVQEHRVSDIIGKLLNRDTRDLRREKPVLVTATTNLVSLCKMNLTDMGEDDALADLAGYYDVELGDDRGRDFTREVFELVPRVLDECRNVENGGAVDYDDMIWAPIVLDLPVYRYDVLCIDELQDLNRCQHELVKRAGKRIIGCGDANQSIYGFSGSDSESIARMTNDLRNMPCVGCHGHGLLDDAGRGSSEGTVCPRCKGHGNRGCVVLPLTVTRRCGKAIVAEARKYVPEFEAHDSNPAGEVRTARFKFKGDEQYLGASKPKLYRDDVRDGDMVLCRTNAPLVSECFKFIKAGKRAEIQGRDVGKGLISTVTKSRAPTVGKLLEWLEKWLGGEIEKEQAKRNPSEAKVQGLQDRYDCLLCFTEVLHPSDPVDGVVRKIEQVFTDNKDSRGIKLSSIHKAKGLEAPRVFILKPDTGFKPRQMKPWEAQQNRNLEYVAITRAIEVLVFVS